MISLAMYSDPLNFTPKMQIKFHPFFTFSPENTNDLHFSNFSLQKLYVEKFPLFQIFPNIQFLAHKFPQIY